jgi:predicted transcriptional regulator
MDTKLTLRLDKEIIERIKILASKQHKSLSALTEELYKSFLLRRGEEIDSEISSPIAKKYKGIINSTDFDAESQKLSYLKDKHLS